MVNNVLTADSYKTELKMVCDRLTQYGKKWMDIMRENGNNLPERVIEEANVVLGNARLLSDGKFKQLAELLDKKENYWNDRIKIDDDIRGFWELISLQVNKVIDHFEKLDRLLETIDSGESAATAEIIATSSPLEQTTTTINGANNDYTSTAATSTTTTSTTTTSTTTTTTTTSADDIINDGRQEGRIRQRYLHVQPRPDLVKFIAERKGKFSPEGITYFYLSKKLPFSTDEQQE